MWEFMYFHQKLWLFWWKINNVLDTRKWLMLCYDSRMKYCFIFYMKMLCLKFEKNYSQCPRPIETHTFFRFWVLFVCLTNAKKTVLVSLNVISLPQPMDSYVLPPSFFYPFCFSLAWNVWTPHLCMSLWSRLDECMVQAADDFIPQVSESVFF